MAYLRSIFFVSLFIVGCAGPNRLTRGLDLKLNQLYVDNPALAEVCLPFGIVGTNVAVVADSCFINPWYFWREAPAGRGTAYYYQDPVTPENQDTLTSQPKDSASNDKANSGKEDSGGGSVKAPVAAKGGRSGGARKKDYISYTVGNGDTFSSIAQKYYGDSHKWKKIYMANQNVVESENKIAPGQMLIIPFK